jgi:pimeloyl-ACP methyl ester carboxylesterase
VAIPARWAGRPISDDRVRQPGQRADGGARRTRDRGEMANDAVAVLAALRIGSAHVAGSSGGSIVAQELALHRPDPVRSLVLQSTWPAVDPLPALVAAVLPAGWSPPPPASGRSSKDSSSTATPLAPTTRAPSLRSSTRCSPSRTSRRRGIYSDTSTRSSTTTRPTACRRSPRRPWCSPAARTRPRVLGGLGGRGAPAVPGGPGPVERTGPPLLEAGRGSRRVSGAPRRPVTRCRQRPTSRHSTCDSAASL